MLGKPTRTALFALVWLLAFIADGVVAMAQERTGTLPTAVSPADDPLPALPAAPNQPPPPTTRQVGEDPTRLLGAGLRAATARERQTLQVPPFGAQLFTGRSAPSTTLTNPDYRIQIGDRIAVRLWGATNLDTVEQVDPEGNIFIPEVGPVQLEGVANRDVSATVRQAVREVFVDGVSVYATLVEASAIGVFVAGYVQAPGRYLGGAEDSLIDYLLRGGGIDPVSGSYRDVTIKRDGRIVVRADLYAFLRDGDLPAHRFAEGDVVVVGPQRPSVVAEGAVRNIARYEFAADGGLAASTLRQLARPLPGVTTVLVSGTRDERPMSRYLALDALDEVAFVDQDRVIFEVDSAPPTVTVSVEGISLGRSIFVADRDARLDTLLDYIQIDPQLANLDAIHVRRVRVAQQQKQSLNDALDRLERAILTANSRTQGEANLRQAEAELVTQFIERARLVQPQGVVVLAQDDGERADLRLEEGDVVVVPQVSDVVVVSGEIVAPQAVVYDTARDARDYVELAGGYSVRGDEDRFIVRKPSGRVLVGDDITIGPGDEIVVPPRIDVKGFQLAADLLNIAFQAAVIAGVVL